MSFQRPYNGDCREFVVAIDIGMTYSGISYSILEPGCVPEVKGVDRFPAQERAGSDCKIPSVLYYDKNETVRAIGAEAAQANTTQRVKDEEWHKVEWLKHHLQSEEEIFVHVFAEFLRYLRQCTEAYVRHNHADGQDILEWCKDWTEYVLTHPSGWETAQYKLRRSEVLAGLIVDSEEGHQHVHFVNEDEACLNFCIRNHLLNGIKDGNGFLIVNAEGVDIECSAYAKEPSSEGRFTRIAPSERCRRGSTSINDRAEAFQIPQNEELRSPAQILNEPLEDM